MVLVLFRVQGCSLYAGYWRGQTLNPEPWLNPAPPETHFMRSMRVSRVMGIIMLLYETTDCRIPWPRQRAHTINNSNPQTQRL